MAMALGARLPWPFGNKKPAGTRSKLSPSPAKSGLLLRCNKAGELYFRWPHGNDNQSPPVTYHVYASGEAFLRERGFQPDDYFPVRIAQELRKHGHIYTGAARANAAARQASSAGQARQIARGASTSREAPTNVTAEPRARDFLASLRRSMRPRND